MNKAILDLRRTTTLTEADLQAVITARDECLREGKRRELAQCLLVQSFVVKWVRSDTDAPPFVRSGELAIEALQIFREVDDKEGQVDALLDALPFQQPEVSQAMLDEATALAEALNDESTTAQILRTKANRLALSDRAAAANLTKQALEIYRRLGSERGQAGCLFSLALQESNDEAKLEAALESARIRRKLGDRKEASKAMLIALMNCEPDALDMREQIALQGLKDAQSVGDRSQEAAFYAHLARIAKGKKQPKEAAKYRRWAKELDEATGNQHKPTTKEAKAFLKDLSKQFPGAGKIKRL